MMTDSEVQSTALETIKALVNGDRPAIDFEGSARIDENAPTARYFDHTLLKPEAVASQYETLCDEALEYAVRSVCVPPDRVAMSADRLRGSVVEVCTVIGFPLGYHTSGAKVGEVERTRELGATEFDMVIPIGRMRDGDIHGIYDDVRAVVEAAGEHIVKVILETALLSDREVVQAGAAALHAGAAILKTSTGFAPAGATVDHVRMLRTVAGGSRGVKAAGGIRDFDFARRLIEAGADRIGASATGAILEQAAGRASASSSKGGGGY
jgi:deoxyribose-phosphate aldolase